MGLNKAVCTWQTSSWDESTTVVVQRGLHLPCITSQPQGHTLPQLLTKQGSQEISQLYPPTDHLFKMATAFSNLTFQRKDDKYATGNDSTSVERRDSFTLGISNQEKLHMLLPIRQLDLSFSTLEHPSSSSKKAPFPRVHAMWASSDHSRRTGNPSGLCMGSHVLNGASKNCLKTPGLEIF